MTSPAPAPMVDLDAAEIARNIITNGGITKDQAKYALDITNANVLVMARALPSYIDSLPTPAQREGGV